MTKHTKKEIESVIIELAEQNNRGELLKTLELLKYLYISTRKLVDLKKITSLILHTRLLGEMILPRNKKHFMVSVGFKEFKEIPVTVIQQNELLDAVIGVKTKQFKGQVIGIINELSLNSKKNITSVNKMIDSVHGKKGTKTRSEFTKQAMKLHNKSNSNNAESLKIRYEDAIDTNDRYEKYIEELNDVIQKSNASDEDKELSKDYTNGLNRT